MAIRLVDVDYDAFKTHAQIDKDLPPGYREVRPRQRVMHDIHNAHLIRKLANEAAHEILDIKEKNACIQKSLETLRSERETPVNRLVSKMGKNASNALVQFIDRIPSVVKSRLVFDDSDTNEEIYRS
jgi:hypothetical protein